MTRTPASPTERSRRTPILLATTVGAALMLCGAFWTTNRTIASELSARQDRATKLATDVKQILRIRERPQQARESALRRSDLLQQVHAAMQSAGIDPAALASTIPQPTRKLPSAPHAEISHRLLFEKITLEQLVRFAGALTTPSPQLHVSAVQLQASAADAKSWNADVTAAYWVVAP